MIEQWKSLGYDCSSDCKWPDDGKGIQDGMFFCRFDKNEYDMGVVISR